MTLISTLLGGALNLLRVRVVRAARVAPLRTKLIVRSGKSQFAYKSVCRDGADHSRGGRRPDEFESLSKMRIRSLQILDVSNSALLDLVTQYHSDLQHQHVLVYDERSREQATIGDVRKTHAGVSSLV